MVYFGQVGLLISQQTQDLKNEIKFSKTLGAGYWLTGNLKEAEKHFHHGLTIARESVGEEVQVSESLVKDV